MGLNFTDYLEQTRLEHARQLLLNSYSSLGVIAHKVGFRDYSYFQ